MELIKRLAWVLCSVADSLTAAPALAADYPAPK